MVIQEAARHYAREDFDYEFAVDTPEEIRALAETLNTMASQLKTRISTIMRQRNELGAMLSSMLEAVIVLDTRLLIKTMNPAAVSLIHKSLDEAIGRSILEVVRNSELHDFSQRVLSNGETLEESVVLYDTVPCYLQAHGTVIRSERGDVEGVLLVMNDITRLKQLENMRKDFVANVSHELKTPITSIKGFVETLQDGALEDAERARHFLSIINRHADRLNAIIDDLLILSKIEDNPTRQISFNRHRLAEVVESALQVCEHQAYRRDIRLVPTCPPEFYAEINPILMEQALVNLVDNAIKYSNPGSTVEVRVLAKESYYVVSIVDSGCGIPERDLPRIFERFYRVDKARSRSLGGTGLGLAIVKHIAIIHGGEVTVDSDEGVGSVFSLILPVEQQVAAAVSAAPLDRTG
jgi:two-component system phosphate regulon sensor histidine kinase PhoR